MDVKLGTVTTYIYKARSLNSPLSERQKQVADLVAEGLTSDAIATALQISPRTVESHRLNAIAKTHANGSAHLTALLKDETIGILKLRIAELEATVLEQAAELARRKLCT